MADQDPCDPCSPCGPFAGSTPGSFTAAQPASACQPGPGNAPITDRAYQCSLGVSLQRTVDSARRIVHQMGLQPYRVKLIWAKRDSRERYQVIQEIELVPVQVDAVEDLSLDLTMVGRQLTGNLVLSKVSPAQVTEYQLRGKLEPDQDPPDDVEFFYEVSRIPRCVTDPPVAPTRFTQSGKPGWDALGYQWIVQLVAQQNPRGPEGQLPDRDGAFRPQRAGPSPGRPRFRR